MQFLISSQKWLKSAVGWLAGLRSYKRGKSIGRAFCYVCSNDFGTRNCRAARRMARQSLESPNSGHICTSDYLLLFKCRKNVFYVIVKFINISTEFVRLNLDMEHSSVALRLEQPMTKKLKSSFSIVHRLPPTNGGQEDVRFCWIYSFAYLFKAQMISSILQWVIVPIMPRLSHNCIHRVKIVEFIRSLYSWETKRLGIQCQASKSVKSDQSLEWKALTMAI